MTQRIVMFFITISKGVLEKRCQKGKSYGLDELITTCKYYYYYLKNLELILIRSTHNT